MDGITDGSLAAVYAGTDGGYPPCTAAACVAPVSYTHLDVYKRQVMVLAVLNAIRALRVHDL